VPRVADGWKYLPAEDRACWDPHVRLRHRREFAPECVERFAEDPSCRPLEPRWVNKMRRTHLRYPHSEMRVIAHNRPDRTRMIEMNVRQENVPELTETRSVLG